MRPPQGGGEDGTEGARPRRIEKLMPRVHITRERGQTAAEYAVVLAVITLAIVLALAAYAEKMRLAIQRIVDIWPG
jgi:Flp pilus assembly pilin Flp